MEPPNDSSLQWKKRAAYVTVSFIVLWPIIVAGTDGEWIGVSAALFYLIGSLLYAWLREEAYSVCANIET